VPTLPLAALLLLTACTAHAQPNPVPVAEFKPQTCGDAPFFGVLREDKRSHIKLSLEQVTFSIVGMTPVIKVDYEKNESTLALINYKRSITGITFRCSY
jgi:hypothetical protein